MLRSVLLVVDSGSAARVVQRAAQLPLTRNATITIAEDAGRRPPAIEIHALTLLAPGRTIQRHAVDSLHGFRLLDLAESCRAELVLIGDEGLFCWRVSALLGRVPVLLVRTARAEGYRHPLVAIEPSGTARVVLGFLRQLFPRRATRMNAVHVSTGSAEQARQVVASMLAEL